MNFIQNWYASEACQALIEDLYDYVEEAQQKMEGTDGALLPHKIQYHMNEIRRQLTRIQASSGKNAN